MKKFKLTLTVLFLLLMQNIFLSQNYWNTLNESDIFNDNPGNVGIGTQYPLAKLHVTGSSMLMGDLNVNDGLYFQSSPYPILRLASTNEYTMYNMWTPTGWHQIDTKGGSDGYFMITSHGQAAGSWFRINNNGNVGIGALDNSYKLTVGGDLGANGSIKWNSGGSILSSDQGGSIELGTNNYSSQTPFIDFHYGTGTSQDFNTRIFNSGNNTLDFLTSSSGKVMTLKEDRVGIGTENPDANYKLSVNGKIRAKEIRVETGWSDFVFKPSYKLLSLNELESYIKTNGHLPDIPTESEVKENGVELGNMTSKLLQKVEELTLYIIEQKKEIEKLKTEIANKK